MPPLHLVQVTGQVSAEPVCHVLFKALQGLVHPDGGVQSRLLYTEARTFRSASIQDTARVPRALAVAGMLAR